MKYKTLAIALFSSMLAAPNAMAGTVWLTGWAAEDGTTRLLGFDEETGQQKYSIEGEGIISADVCDKTGSVYFLDLTTLKSVDVDGNVRVIEENIGESFSGVTQVKVGQRYCTVWAYAIGNTEIHIIRHPAESRQERIDTVAFDMIAAADIDDSNDDLWIGQYNGRIYRVSKKTGLRSYRIEPTGSWIHTLAVHSGNVHVMRNDGLTGYANTTRRDNPQQLYFDTSYQSLFDSNAYYSTAGIYTNALGEPVISAFNLYFDGGARFTSEVLRMEMNIDNGTLQPTNDRFIPFEDFAGTPQGHGQPASATGRNLWMYNSEVLRLVDPAGITQREIDYQHVHGTFHPYNIAY